MGSLIIVVLVICIKGYCKKREKKIKDRAITISTILLLLFLEWGLIITTVVMAFKVKEIPKCQENNEAIEAQMRELTDDFYLNIENHQSKENFEELFEVYAIEYSELKAKFDENNETIRSSIINQKRDLPILKFLLYFGH